MASAGSIVDWYDIRKVEDKLSAVNIIIGGRGIGKTYSALGYIIEKGKPFIYLRNTVVQLNESVTEFGNPFKRWNKDHDRNIYFKPQRSHALIYDDDLEDGRPVGYGMALSTFENLRGVDLSDVEYVLFDEFIEKRTLSFRQFECFISFYETVNRNRELLGEKPLCCILLSNAQKLDNPILAGYGIIPTIENMIRTGQKEYRKPGMYLSLPACGISDLKRDTVNYTLINGTNIAAEALDNTFAFDSFHGIRKRNISEYVPVVQIDDIFIYKHKSVNRLYACMIQAQNIPVFTSRDNLTGFLRGYGRKLWDAVAKDFLEYSDFVTKSKLLDIIK